MGGGGGGGVGGWGERERGLIKKDVRPNIFVYTMRARVCSSNRCTSLLSGFVCFHFSPSAWFLADRNTDHK